MDIGIVYFVDDGEEVVDLMLDAVEVILELLEAFLKLDSLFFDCDVGNVDFSKKFVNSVVSGSELIGGNVGYYCAIRGGCGGGSCLVSDSRGIGCPLIGTSFGWGLGVSSDLRFVIVTRLALAQLIFRKISTG